jgi:general nucleoside transport system ATP-binding protein
MNYAVQMKGITKDFPGVRANDKIDFFVEKGEVHGLLGENGAGKTVLMRTLYGLYRPDDGQIFINGKEVTVDSPATAIRSGIGMVHQNFMLVPSLTVTENIILGHETTKNKNLLDLEKASEDIEVFSKRFNLDVDPNIPIYVLPVGIQQRVEILKALYRGAEILILDEPTAILTPQEVEMLFKAIRTLKAQGKTIIFISHKLREVVSICDKITVLKKGRMVGTVKKEETTLSKLANMMVDRQLLETFDKKAVDIDQVVLKIENLQANNERNLPALKGINLDVRAYEILGLVGVEGNGQSELVEALVGLRETTKGKILLKNMEINALSPEERIRLGVSHVPEDRIKRGLIQDFSVMENLILGSQSEVPFAKRRLIIDNSEIVNFSNRLIKDYSIKTPSNDTPVRNLSGGTQQRVVLARELSRDPKLVIAYQPSRGLDIGATEYVRIKLVEMRDQGCAVLLISADLDEVRALSDRIAVIYEGKIVAERKPWETNEEDLGLLMAGGKIE